MLASYVVKSVTSLYSTYVEAKDDSSIAALEFFGNLADYLGTEVKSQEPLLKIVGSTIYCGLVEWKIDDIVTDRKGHAFRGMLLAHTNKTRGAVDVCDLECLNSIQAFVLCFCVALMSSLEETINVARRNGKDTRKISVPDNIGIDIEDRINRSGWSTQTSDEFQFIDGGSKLVIESSYVLVNKVLKAPWSEGYSKADPQLCELVIPMAFDKFGIVHAFNKGMTFLAGDLVYCLDEDGTVCMYSSKKAKGVKRVLLPLAQVAKVLNARPSGWMLPRQREQIVGHVVKAALFPTCAFMPGHSAWIGEYKSLPTAQVKHTYRGFEIDSEEGRADINFAINPISVEIDGSWTVANFEDACINPGDVIAFANGAEVEHGGCASLLQWIRWQVAVTLGGRKRLVVEWQTITEERIFKGRSIAKAQPILADSSILYNEMNENLPEGIDLVHFQDGIKADLHYSWLLVASTTAIHNQDTDLLGIISDINKVVTGVAHCEYLYIDPPSVFKGLYQQLLEAFVSKYGRSAWLQFPHAGDFAWMMEQLYVANTPDGWSEVEITQGQYEFPAHLTIRAFADGDVQNERTNVLVFLYSNGELVEHWQRAFGYVGAQNLEGFETSTVQQSVSSSMQLPAYARSLARLHGLSMKEQQSMMSEGHSKRVLIKALHVMNAGLVGTGAVDTIDLRTESSRLIELVTNAGIDLSMSGRKALFGQLSALLKDTWLIVSDELTVWLPALFSLAKVKTDSDKGMSVSGLVRQYLLLVLNDEEVDHDFYGRRVKGMLRSVLESESSWKLQGGREMASAKRVGLPCVPCDEVWVLESEDPNSFYNQCRSLGLKEGDTVGNNRAPMADGTVAKLRYISAEKNSRLFWKLNPFQVFISPMASNIDGGDFDGDPHFLTRVREELPLTTREQARAIRSNIIGIDMFDVACNAYARDHYGIKSFAKVQHGAVRACFCTKEQFVSRLVGAAIVQQQMVGFAYSLANLPEVANELLSTLADSGVDIPMRLRWATRNGNATVGKAFELYEVPLGGYSEESFAFWTKYVSKLMGTKDLFQITDLKDFAATVAAMGADTRSDAASIAINDLRDLAAGFNTAAVVNFACKRIDNPEVSLEILRSNYADCRDLEQLLFVFAVAFALFESARGSNIGAVFVDSMGAPGTKGANVFQFILEYHAAHQSEEWYQTWLSKSAAMQAMIKHIAKDLFSATIYSSVGNLLPADVELLAGKLPKLAEPAVKEVVSEVVHTYEEAVTLYEEDWAPEAPAEDNDWDLSDLNEVESNLEEVVVAAEEVETKSNLLNVVSTTTIKGGKSTGQKVAAVFSAMADSKGHIVACNSNLPIGNLTGDFNADIRKAGPNYAAFGFGKGGDVGGFAVSMVGFTAASMCLRVPTANGSKSTWAPIARVEGEKLDRNGVTVVLGTKTNGKLDLDCSKEAEIGEGQMHRTNARRAMLDGRSGSFGSIQLEANESVKAILADGKRHYFVVVGEVEEIRSLRSERGTQSQVVVSSMVVAHIADVETAFCHGQALHGEIKADALISTLSGYLNTAEELVTA